MIATASVRAKLFTITLILLVSSWAGAQGLTLEGEAFELSVAPGAKIVRRVDSAQQTHVTLAHEGQKIQIRFGADDLFVNFPTSTLRLRKRVLDSAGAYQLVTDFAGKRYTVKRSRKEISWLLPGQEVFFRTRGGKVIQAVGTADFLKLRRNTPAKRVVLESSAGVTDATLINGELELFDGPEVEGHVYFVRGLAFQQGPITLRIPLPDGPFFDALPADRYHRVVHTPAPLPEPAPRAVKVEKKDPLQAEPSTWDSPIYRANNGEKGKDPLNARREKRTDWRKRALEAKEQRNSEEVLRVKGD